MATRFDFGRNWLGFAAGLSDEQIAAAQESLRTLLGRSELSGVRFLDVGSGSGLFSLVARRLGAHVQAFDADRDAVACTRALRDHYRPGDTDWTIAQGSILDATFTRQLGAFDVVYAWGVLHHTGALWRALEQAALLTAPDGMLAVAIYRKTPLCGAWRIEKRLYAAAPQPVRAVMRGAYKAALHMLAVVRGRRPVRAAAADVSERGMDRDCDLDDWLGGYPYESASASEVMAHLERLGLDIVGSRQRPAGWGLTGSGCDEYVCRRRVP